MYARGDPVREAGDRGGETVKKPTSERCFLAGVLVSEAQGLVSGVSRMLEHPLDSSAKARVGNELDRSRHLFRDAVITHGAACRREFQDFQKETEKAHRLVVSGDTKKAGEEILAAQISALECVGNLHESCAPNWQKIVQRGEYGWERKAARRRKRK